MCVFSMRLPESSDPKLVKSSRFFVLLSLLGVVSILTFAESLALCELLLLLFVDEPVFCLPAEQIEEKREWDGKMESLSFR